MTNLIKELIGDKPGRLMLQLPRLKYDISVSDYIIYVNMKYNSNEIVFCDLLVKVSK